MKRKDTFFEILEWTLFIGMFIVSMTLTWKVLEQYNSKATSFQVFQEEITKHPTITMCFEKWREDGTEFKTVMEYEKNFDIKIYLEEESSLHLQLGINYYNNSTGELVYFDKMYSTYYSGACYNITSILEIRKGKQNRQHINIYDYINTKLEKQKGRSKQKNGETRK